VLMSWFGQRGDKLLWSAAWLVMGARRANWRDLAASTCRKIFSLRERLIYRETILQKDRKASVEKTYSCVMVTAEFGRCCGRDLLR
jgi:hypothetical protein